MSRTLSADSFEQLFASAIAEAAKFSSQKLSPEYVADFRRAWNRLEGNSDAITVDHALVFASTMAERWPDWKLTAADVAMLEQFRGCGNGQIPMIAFARFSEDVDFTPTAYLTGYLGSSRKITVGNTARSVDGGVEWTLYVRDTEGVVESVTFELHETFNPRRVVVKAAPFSVTRVGWGAFTVRVAVQLKSGSQHEFAHELSLSKTVEHTHALIEGAGPADSIAVTPAHAQWLTKGGHGEHVATMQASSGPDSSIAVVDLSPGNKQVAEELVAALKRDGFAYLRNYEAHTEAAAEPLMRRSDALFAHVAQNKVFQAPARERFPQVPMKCARGYTPVRQERLNPSLGGDLKESFDYGGSCTDAPFQVQQHLGQNRFPEERQPGLKGFRSDCLVYLDEMRRLCRHVLGLICRGLGVEGNEIRDAFADPLIINRLLRYGPQSKLQHKPDEMGAGSHIDYGACTFIAQDRPGLEVYRSGSESWEMLPVIKGTLVLNTGFILEKFTNGLLPATKHRVINRDPTESRHSIATFFDPNPLAAVKPLPQFVDQTGGAPKYSPCCAGHKGVLVHESRGQPQQIMMSQPQQWQQHQQYQQQQQQQQQQQHH